MLLMMVCQVDKDAIAKWVFSSQAHPSDEAEINNGITMIHLMVNMLSTTLVLLF